jgi:ATP-dependent Lon protease
VLLPSRNEADLDDIPPELREQLDLKLVDTVDQVLREALPGLFKPKGAGKPAAVQPPLQ